MIDPTFRNINRLFALPFKSGDNDPTRNYYISLAEIKDCNALIENKWFFDQPVKNKQKVYEKHVEMPRKCTKRNLLDYSYHQIYYKLIGINLSRQTNTSIPLQVNFPSKLEEDDGATMFFIAEKQQKTILNFSLDSLIVTELYKQQNTKKYWAYWMKSGILKFQPETEILSMINQMQNIA